MRQAPHMFSLQYILEWQAPMRGRCTWIRAVEGYQYGLWGLHKYRMLQSHREPIHSRCKTWHFTTTNCKHYFSTNAPSQGNRYSTTCSAWHIYIWPVSHCTNGFLMIQRARDKIDLFALWWTKLFSKSSNPQREGDLWPILWLILWKQNSLHVLIFYDIPPHCGAQ